MSSTGFHDLGGARVAGAPASPTPPVTQRQAHSSMASLGAVFFGRRFRAAFLQTASSIAVMCDRLWTVGGRLARGSSTFLGCH